MIFVWWPVVFGLGYLFGRHARACTFCGAPSRWICDAESCGARLCAAHCRRRGQGDLCPIHASEAGSAHSGLIALVLFFLFVIALVGCAAARESLDGGVDGEARYVAPRFLDVLHPSAAQIRVRYGWPYPVRVPGRACRACE